MIYCNGCFEAYDSQLDICPHCGYYDGEEKENNAYLDVGTRLNDRYIIGSVAGQGSFGITYYAWDEKLQQKLAIKEYLPSEFSTRMYGSNDAVVFSGDKETQFNIGKEKFTEEANKLIEFRNTPGVVDIKESFAEYGTAYIVMEYLDGETLSEYLKKNPKTSAEQTISMLMPIIQSLKTIHAKGVIHRDIAPDNIMLTKSGSAKLIDFGASKHAITSKTRSMSVITKAGYSPEEQYRSDTALGAHTDVYALAATMYHMITGVKPPISIERTANYKEKKKDLLIPIAKLNENIGENQEIAISNALNIQPEQRTADMQEFEAELTSQTPVKRRSGKIKATDMFTWPLWLKVGVAAAASFLIVLISLFSLGILGFDANLETEIVIAEGLTRVPLIVSDSSQEAEQKLISSNLNYQIVGKTYSESTPENYVLTQDLTAGSLVDENSVINVVISAGVQETLSFVDSNGMYTLADVQFQDKQTALDNLQTAQEMTVTIVEEYSDTVAADLVISQSPESGTLLEPGSEITITISLGSEGFELQSFISMTEDEAKDALSELGLIVSISYVNNTELEEGTVVSQDIEEGTIVFIGSTVTIEVVNNENLAVVPDVIGLSQSEAQEVLEDLGFTVQFNIPDSTQTNLKVSSQNPESGTYIETGSCITMNLTGTAVTTTAAAATTTKATTTTTATTTTKATTTTNATTTTKATTTTTKAATTTTKAATTTTTTTKATTTTTQKSTFTINFDANSGSVSKSSMTATVSVAYGTLPTPTRDYYTFDGWYTSKTGGTLVTSTSKSTSASDITLYAHWTQNELSDWVLASSVPSNAQVVNQKWTYDLTSYTTSSSSSMSGWTKYDSSYTWSDYGSWSSWSTTVYTESDSRDVETQSVSELTSYKMVTYNTMTSSGSRQFRNFSINGAYTTYGVSSSYGEHNYSTTISAATLNSATKISSGSYTSRCTYPGYNKSSTTGYIISYNSKTYVFFISDKIYTSTTQYKYRDRSKIYTYYYSKVESMESTTYPSGSDISNISEYVQYRLK